MRKINTRQFQRATRTTSREINRQIVLNLIREHQPISRADLARWMEVKRGMVSSLVKQLLEEGVIYEGAAGSAPRGRKPTLLHLRAHDRLAMAIDVRSSETCLMLQDFSGRVVALDSLSTPDAPEDLVTELASRVAGMLRSHARGGSCEGIGLVAPGVVDHATGTILHAPSLGWRDVDLRSALAARVGLPVHIERDAIACAMAQIWLGRAGRDGIDSFVYVTLSDGVGAGLVVGGQVVRGHRDTAGEFGHIPLSPDGPACLCGGRGCWEAYVSNPATIARYLGRDLSTREAHLGLRQSGFTIADLIARARSGDVAAAASLQETGRFLGMGLATIVNALNPARIIVGGEVTAAWDLLAPPAREALRKRTLTEAAADTPIIPEPADGHTRLRGATALVLAPVFAAPLVA